MVSTPRLTRPQAISIREFKADPQAYFKRIRRHISQSEDSFPKVDPILAFTHRVLDASPREKKFFLSAAEKLGGNSKARVPIQNLAVVEQELMEVFRQHLRSLHPKKKTRKIASRVPFTKPIQTQNQSDVFGFDIPVKVDYERLGPSC